MSPSLNPGDNIYFFNFLFTFCCLLSPHPSVFQMLEIKTAYKLEGFSLVDMAIEARHGKELSMYLESTPVQELPIRDRGHKPKACI